MSNESNTPPTELQPQGGQASNPPAQGANSPSQGDQSSTSTTTHRSAEELERLNAELMRDNANYRKKAREQEIAVQAAEQERLKQQGEYKQLAETHEKRVKELEPLAALYQELADLVNAQIEVQIKDWPAEVKAFDPGKDASVKERQTWVNKSLPLVTKLVQTQPGTPGNSPGPKPVGSQQAQQQDVATLKDRYSATRGRLF
jgi:hypothetical protein